jgi:hypothetical protein
MPDRRPDRVRRPQEAGAEAADDPLLPEAEGPDALGPDPGLAHGDVNEGPLAAAGGPESTLPPRDAAASICCPCRRAGFVRGDG